VAILVQSWETSGLAAELVWAGPGAALVEHRHAEAHVLIVLDGLMTDDGRPYRSGDARASSASDVHFVRFSDRAACLIVRSVSDARLPRVRDRWSGRLPVARTARMASVVARAGTLGSPLTDGELQGLVDETLDRFALAQHAVLASPAPLWLSELRDRLARAEGPSFGAAHWARLAGVSREHLARSFRRHFGTSLTTYRCHTRVAHACRLMDLGVRPLRDIALEAGFADQSHMTRVFRRCLGGTPAQAALQVCAAGDITPVQDARAPRSLLFSV
jgi:AraC-like DNA-binding protein